MLILLITVSLSTLRSSRVWPPRPSAVHWAQPTPGSKCVHTNTPSTAAQHPAGAESGDKPVSGHERSSSSSTSSSSSSMQLQLLCTLQLPSRGSLQPDTGRCCSCLGGGRGGAGRGHQGEGRTVTISSALDWPPACTGHPPPRRLGFIGAVFSRAACNPRLGRAADCHTRGPWVTSWPRSRVTCHAVPILAPAPH